MKKSKAYVLISGGLDSMLAVKVLQEQGIEVVGVCMESNFYGCARAKEVSEILNIQLDIIDIKKEMLELVKNPPHGHGKNMNPCIDCHSLMIRILADKIKNKKDSFIATGEVLGQRPFSQNFKALKEVALTGKYDVLRPLSAKLLSETQAEINGLVDRGKLLDIQGRTRKRQLELVEKFKIKKYPSPGGGCMLTEVDFGDKLKSLIDKWPNCDTLDIEAVKSGRTFWLNFDNEWIMLQIGRNQKDNIELEKNKKRGDVLIEALDEKGPLGLIRFKREVEIVDKNIAIKIPDDLNTNELKEVKIKSVNNALELAGRMLGYFAPKLRGKEIKLDIKK